MPVRSLFRGVGEATHEVQVLRNGLGRMPDEQDSVVPRRRQLVDGEPSRHGEVDVHAVQSSGVLRHADQHDGDTELGTDGDTLVNPSDVHQDDRVAQLPAG